MTESTGIVFDIQRASFHDGPGIRTAVFLKGCPLSCQWCHNPESQRLRPEILYRKDKCVLCCQCTAVCPHGCHSSGDGVHRFNRVDCTGCGACASVCPSGALVLKGETKSVTEVLEVVKRDQAYFEESGGGLTLTGGEPLLQADFALALLQSAKTAGIHTCVETCGCISARTVMAALPLIDLFLYDYKVTDAEEHRRYTGCSNRLILDNLDLVCRQGSRIILRCPIIPGINDNDRHLNGIAGIASRYPQIERVELLAYHNLGEDKHIQIGRGSPLRKPNANETDKAFWLERLNTFGCHQAMIG